MSKAKIAILVGSNGRGSNAKVIAQACEQEDFPAELTVCVSPVPESRFMKEAEELEINLAVVPYGDNYGDRLLAVMGHCDWVCLAGYLRLLPPQILNHFPGHILNIHPSLLPKYGGKGMYGINVHRAVIREGDEETGCTVHRITEVYDQGEIIIQRRCPVWPDDTPETLAARVLREEHQAYPEAIVKVLSGNPE